MRPRHQRGQIARRGPNWVLRFHEDRLVDGAVKRVRAIESASTLRGLSL